MTKQDFVALADSVRDVVNEIHDTTVRETGEELVNALAAFCRSQNPRFDEQQWRDYLAGKCGPNGGKR